ncbi:hypothetical protein Dsin_005512 [Dipteronia sinensis]|uniref:Uncharacterized protein n=1 Tax=Dipteronia sinensis TaxID=43782 RepID=A0AAE0AXH6_9ROSI|nr:hypothetical protein Dsin_005512 [Dipteronia sinensis]
MMTRGRWPLSVLCPSLPITYLGLPLGGNPKKEALWSPVIQKVKERLVPWKRSFIFKGGRLVLIKAVLSSLPTFYMSVFGIPAGVVKNIKKFQREFSGMMNQRSFKIIKDGFQVVVGSGDKIRFWKDLKWDSIPLYVAFPRIFALDIQQRRILGLFEEKGEEGGQVGDTCNKSRFSNINELVSKNTDLMMRMEVLEKERDEAIKRAEDLTRIIEEQEEDFTRKTRKMQWQVELKDKAIDAIKEELSRKEVALKVVRVKECDRLVELEKAESTIKVLTEEQSIMEEILRYNTIERDANHPKERVTKIGGSSSYFPYKCHFCHTRGHKKAQCVEFIGMRKKKQSMPKVKPRKIRQVWVQKDKLDQVRDTIVDEKKTLDSEECPKLLDMKGGGSSGELRHILILAAFSSKSPVCCGHDAILEGRDTSTAGIAVADMSWECLLGRDRDNARGVLKEVS